jgi:hypothetical protein
MILLVKNAAWLLSAQFRCGNLSGLKVAHIQWNVMKGLMQNILKLGFLQKFF